MFAASTVLLLMILLERENIAKEVDMDCQGIVEVIAKEVDDEKPKETAAENSSSSRTGWPVDRPGRPAAASGTRSTGAVDRRAQRAQRNRSVDRPVDRLK